MTFIIKTPNRSFAVTSLNAVGTIVNLCRRNNIPYELFVE